MAKNAFTKFQGFVDKPKRNTFDLSFQSNLTCGFGDLVPVFCKEVIPGDSFRIDPTFGFRMMPLVFPVQTKMSANLHFFYVRNRNLWKDWPDFIGKTKSGLTPPYLAPENEEALNDLYKTGSLGDYMGLPTTLVGDYGYNVDFQCLRYSSNTYTGFFALKEKDGIIIREGNKNQIPLRDNSPVGMPLVSSNSPVPPRYFGFQIASTDDATTLQDVRLLRSVRFNVPNPPSISRALYLLISFFDPTQNAYCTVGFEGTVIKEQSVEGFNMFWTINDEELFLHYMRNVVPQHYSETYGLRVFLCDYHEAVSGSDAYVNPRHESVVRVGFTSRDIVDVSSMGRVPFHAYGGDQSDKIRISALPFRAYESIYNAFYRNQQNDPFMINGEPEYNKFIENQEGGADHYRYKLRQRNWEKDFLTTCVSSPQQGIAPLVGVSSTGQFTFEAEDGAQYTAKASVDDSGKLTGIETMDSKLVENGTGRLLVDMVSNGISINDFRNVNALQRWLETNIRRGLRYKDQIMSHFGVDPDYAAMDMPEFIGGISRPVNVSTVTQTSEGVDDPLGSYAGNATVFGQGKSVTKYCDEHGFIIGILSVVPTPNYSQLLPKLFLKSDPLDYFFPEFGHIGMQAIPYTEVCPVQAFYHDETHEDEQLHKTFGYQRAWYDYLGSVDEVHGLMRTELRNFVMNRTFNIAPELGAEFLHIDQRQLNQVFADTTTSDKIIGIIDFKVSAKRPIPMFGIPRLE